MIRSQTFRRTLFIGLLALVAVGPITLLVAPETDAVSCPGNVHSDVFTQWIVTEAAQDRTDSGEYCDSLKPICREECLVGCGESFPQGNFACFAS